MISQEEFWDGVNTYIGLVRKELHARWDSWSFEFEKKEVYEVIGALMARQVSLATQMAMNPGIWNGHVAPLLLRTMVDTFISLRWILDSPLERSRKYIEHGLGQEKLQLEHFKNTLRERGVEVDDNELIKAREGWINNQKYSFLTEVDVGSWSGKSTRQMADEADCMSIYRHAYTPFSSCTHSMWNHIEKYNTMYCENPLHQYHRVPVDKEVGIEPDYLFRAAKYVEKTFDHFDEEFGVEVNTDSGFKHISDLLDEFYYEKSVDEEE